MFLSKRDTNCIDKLKLRLKSVTKLKISEERRTLKLRNIERSLCEELYATNTEIDFLTEQLEDLKDKISMTTNQISRIEIYNVAEKCKMEIKINDMNAHKRGFDALFDRERDLSVLRNKELKEKEAVQLELERQRQLQINEKNEQQAREAAAIEQECDVIERECTVLKKRNNAIMLKLRRKLVETENARRELMRKMDIANENNTLEQQ